MVFDQIRNGVMAFVFISVLAAAGAIALDEFNDDLTADSAADNVTDEGLRGILNSTSFFDTIGTLLGVGALIAVVAGAIYLGVRK